MNIFKKLWLHFLGRPVPADVEPDVSESALALDESKVGAAPTPRHQPGLDAYLKAYPPAHPPGQSQLTRENRVIEADIYPRSRPSRLDDLEDDGGASTLLGIAETTVEVAAVVGIAESIFGAGGVDASDSDTSSGTDYSGDGGNFGGGGSSGEW